MIGLTPKQRELLDFVERFIAGNGGVAPTFAQMGAGMGIISKSGVHRLLTALEERGLIRRHKNRARSIEIVTQPAGLRGASDRTLAAELQRRGWTCVPPLRPDNVTLSPDRNLPEPLAEPPAESGSGLSVSMSLHAPENTCG